ERRDRLAERHRRLMLAVEGGLRVGIARPGERIGLSVAYHEAAGAAQRIVDPVGAEPEDPAPHEQAHSLELQPQPAGARRCRHAHGNLASSSDSAPLTRTRTRSPVAAPVGTGMTSFAGLLPAAS